MGNVVGIALPSGKWAFARVLEDASVGVYRELGDSSGSPPIGSRDYQFVVGIYDDALRALPVVGYDASIDGDDAWPPPYRITDPITGGHKIYERGEIRPATEPECEGLEPAAVWDIHHITERIEAHDAARGRRGSRS